MDESGGGNWVWFIPFLVGLLIAHYFWPIKYEGETAEYWFNAYDSQVAETDDKNNCLSDIESEASYWSTDDYGELQDKIDNINSMAANCQ